MTITTKIQLNQVYPIPAPAFNSELTGTPTAPTPSTSDDSNKIATTEYVKDNLDNYLPLSGGTVISMDVLHIIILQIQIGMLMQLKLCIFVKIQCILKETLLQILDGLP